MNTKILELIQNRVCKACKESKPINEFHFHKGNDAYTHKCATCHVVSESKRSKAIWKERPEYRERHNAQGKINRKINPDMRKSDMKSRPDKVLRLYGVTWDYVVQTLAKQFGRCANLGCGEEISLEVKGVKRGRAVIDHDHKTGKFRALLCVDCNCVLGHLETKNTKVLGLMDYINKHKG